MASRKASKKPKKEKLPTSEAAPVVRPRGGQTKYTRQLADEICDRLSEGETLTSICAEDHMPNRQCVLAWKRADIDGFAIRYARAREEQRELWSDELIDIADDARNDWMERQVAGGEVITVINKEAVDRSKLRADTRKWLLTKLDRATYGEKVEQTHKGDEAFLGLWSRMGGGKTRETAS